MDNCAKICAIAFVFLMVGCEEATKEKEQDGAAGASNGAAGASNGAAGAQCADGSPLPMPSLARQRVTFNLRNSSSETRFIVQAGASCNTFGIQGMTGTGEDALVLRVSSISCNGQCGRCSCDAPAPSASEILAIEPGGTHAFEWDATAYASCQAPIATCPEQSMTFYARQAVAPGTYRVLVPVATVLPTHCSPKGATGVFACSPGGLSVCVPLRVCPLEKIVTVDFAVPESGDVQVDVPIS
ncbi:MAG TPA: hypothetical protein VKP30_31050 [Polyangiaceae bacterium]|nr:hypothetical protein [Polyangiaceae bacterium]